MKHVLFFGIIFVSVPTLAQTSSQPGTDPVQRRGEAGRAASNPWDLVPAVAPYRNLADAIKAEAKPGEASPLNPSCEGKTGDACVRSEEQR